MIQRMAIAALTLIVGCHIGPSIKKYGPAISPAGINSIVRLFDRSSFGGELLSVTSDDVTIMFADEILRIPATLIDRIKIDHRKRSLMVQRAPLSDETLAILRPLTRFPVGISDDVLVEMLAGLSQDSVKVLSVEGS